MNTNNVPGTMKGTLGIFQIWGFSLFFPAYFFQKLLHWVLLNYLSFLALIPYFLIIILYLSFKTKSHNSFSIVPFEDYFGYSDSCGFLSKF